MGSAYHAEATWATVGPVQIMYHANISVSIAVNYDQRSVFGSHGAYAVWLNTDPRALSASASMVAANAGEVGENFGQCAAAWNWTQGSPPPCLPVSAPAASVFNMPVRPESYDASIPEGSHVEGGGPLQIDLSVSTKECKPI